MDTTDHGGHRQFRGLVTDDEPGADRQNDPQFRIDLLHLGQIELADPRTQTSRQGRGRSTAPLAA
jgi:hypothetical protein